MARMLDSTAQKLREADEALEVTRQQIKSLKDQAAGLEKLEKRQQGEQQHWEAEMLSRARLPQE